MSSASHTLLAICLTASIPFISNPTNLRAEVSGNVYDETTSDPIEGAIVTLQATATRTTTDADGYFEFPDLEGDDLVIVAAYKGYFHGAQIVTSPATEIEILLEAVPQDDDEDHEFLAATECGFCHTTHYGEWANSRMGNTGENRWVYDLFNGTGTSGGAAGWVYTEDSQLKDVKPNGECAACHQPLHWIMNGRDAALVDINDPTPEALQGVGCDFCHKIADVTVENIGIPGFPPEVVTITRPSGDTPQQVQYGVLGDVNYTDILMRPSYQPQIRAEACGLCHEEKTDPDNDGDFDEPGGVLAQSTYTDWAASKYGKVGGEHYMTCADCHLPAKDPNALYEFCRVLDPSVVRPGSQVHSHAIQGTTPVYLENAVTMTMSAELGDGQVTATVSIENDRTGHHVPGGVPLHHMVLLVEATTETGESLVATGPQVIDEIGGIGEPAKGDYYGLAGKVYGKILEDAAGNFPVFYTEAAAEHYDTRIAADATDTTEYTFALPKGGNSVTVNARLIYRRAWRELLKTKGWETDGQGGKLEDIEAPHFGHLMEEANSVVALPPRFIRGDVTGDADLNLTDPILQLDYMFGGGQIDCVDAADVNDDGDIVLNDPILTLNYLFSAGPAPAAPFPGCGTDATPDEGGIDLGCTGTSAGCSD